MKAMILAAGLGTRLRPLTYERAKPAIAISGKPLIIHTLEKLTRFGANRFRANLHHLPETIESIFCGPESEQFDISFSYEPEILGTGGGLKANEHFFDSQTFLMVNADVLFDFDIREAINFHKSCGALATLVMVPQRAPYQFYPIRMDQEGILLNFKGEHPGGSPLSETFVFSGVHILEPRIFDYIPVGCFYEINDQVYPAAIRNGELIRGFPCQGYWNDLGTPENYLKAQAHLLQASNRAFCVGNNVSIADNVKVGQNTAIGENCILEDETEVENTIIWEDVRLKKGARLNYCISGSNVVLTGDYKRKIITKEAEIEF